MANASGMSCSCTFKDKDTVLKRYTDGTRFSKLWFAITPEELINKIVSYNNDLQSIGLNIPVLHKVSLKQNSIIEIEQQFIPGKNASELMSAASFETSLNLFRTILQIQHRVYLGNRGIHVDINVFNFIVSADNSQNIFLVDVTPPLYDKAIPYPEEYIDQCYYYLCFSLENQICELIYSFTKKFFLGNPDPDFVKKAFESLIVITSQVWAQTEYADVRSWFANKNYLSFESSTRTFARLKLIEAYCNKEIGSDELKKHFLLFSISHK